MSRTVLRPRHVLAVLAILLALGGMAAMRALAATSPSNELTYQWSMAERFGDDADRDGRIDYRTDAAYLKGTEGYKVTFDACDAPAVKDRDPVTIQMRWHITGTNYDQSPTSASCRYEHTFQTLKAYTVTASLLDKVSGAELATTAATAVTPKDIFIAAVGDSIGSGEGNPDTLGPVEVGPFPFFGPVW